ncbi:alpha/beta fold hydrolase [Ramlibacter sp. H39-3-26]|uniref:esterase/lipase family protein n=1 Tax=Curvibacter soli TaxID=3031331 RepID=UPI0023D9F388|nr:alpha/beta fold hydrolase [Ramlibacter sp. H39-3-26]MDF1486440.1 alpha/beta fold hydrolase [Ramlibacter sp. H39-3-26]
MTARLQRALMAVLLAALAAWLAWALPRWPLLAAAGALLILFGYAAVLGAECALMHWANRGDPAPRASLAQVLRAWWGEAGMSPRVFYWRQPLRANAVPDLLSPGPGAPQRGVVLVHGYLCNRGFWNPWLQALRARGQVCIAVNLEPPFGPIDGYAATIDAAVRRATAATGLPPVLVCHSMGGLAARAWLRAWPDAAARVRRIVTIGAPHHGTWLARFSGRENVRQMRRRGPWLRALRAHEPAGRAALFTCWYSNCDNVVFPASTATLAGADNRFIAGVAHVGMAFHPQVMRAVLDECAA